MYAFSTENWRRPPDEVRYLMGFNKGILERHARGSERAQRPDPVHRAAGLAGASSVIKRMDWATELTRTNTGLTFTIAFNYGGRAEIVDAVRALVATGVRADKIDEKAIRRHFYDPEMPDPDLVIRTSGEHRISNYLLWELAYSELVFTDVLWPDFRKQHSRIRSASSSAATVASAASNGRADQGHRALPGSRDRFANAQARRS